MPQACDHLRRGVIIVSDPAAPVDRGDCLPQMLGADIAAAENAPELPRAGQPVVKAQDMPRERVRPAARCNMGVYIG